MIPLGAGPTHSEGTNRFTPASLRVLLASLSAGACRVNDVTACQTHQLRS